MTVSDKSEEEEDALEDHPKALAQPAISGLDMLLFLLYL